MPVVSRLIYEVVKWRARRGLTRDVESFADAKAEAKQRGVRGETFAYWYLRRQGVCIYGAELCAARREGRNRSSRIRRDTLAFVEVRTRTAQEDQTALPELSVTLEKQQVVARTARRFLLERHVKECPMRFDVGPSKKSQANRPWCGCTRRRFIHRCKAPFPKEVRIRKNLVK